MSCTPLAPDNAYLTGMLGYVDCQAQAIGAGGYQALASPGAPAGALLGIALVIFVALFGYSLLLGEVPGVRNGVMAAVKIGLVLALATSWPAFRTLAYDVAMRGPAELSSAIGGNQQIPGATGGLVPHLQYLDDSIAELNILGTGRPPNAELSTANSPQQLTPAQQQRLNDRPHWDPERDAWLLGTSRILYLVGTIGAFASVRLLAGLLLALGPLFALFLLFDGTRGLFEGWVRALGGAALGALATSLLLGVQLALMEPWLANVLALRYLDVATPEVPVELIATNLVFDIALVAVLIGIARATHGFHIPQNWRTAPREFAERLREERFDRTRVPAHAAPAMERTRASVIADAVAATQRRELSASLSPAMRVAEAAASGNRAAARDGGSSALAAPPLGQSHRRNRGRISERAARRDRTT